VLSTLNDLVPSVKIAVDLPTHLAKETAMTARGEGLRSVREMLEPMMEQARAVEVVDLHWLQSGSADKRWMPERWIEKLAEVDMGLRSQVREGKQQIQRLKDELRVMREKPRGWRRWLSRRRRSDIQGKEGAQSPEIDR